MAPKTAYMFTHHQYEGFPDNTPYRFICHYQLYFNAPNFDVDGASWLPHPTGDLLDTDRMPTMWLTSALYFPDEWPWRVGDGGAPGSFNAIYDWHGIPQVLGNPQTRCANCWSNGSAPDINGNLTISWGFGFVSSVRMDIRGAPTAAGIPATPELQTMQDLHGTGAYPDAYRLKVGAWNFLLHRVVWGLESQAYWDRSVRKSPTRPIGLWETWLNDDILRAPNAPTWATYNVSTLRHARPADWGYSDANWYTQRVVWAQFGTYFTNLWGNDLPVRYAMRQYLIGSTMQEALNSDGWGGAGAPGYPGAPYTYSEKSTYGYYVTGCQQRGLTPGPNLGDAMVTEMADPGFPVPGGGSSLSAPPDPAPGHTRIGLVSATGSGISSANQIQLNGSYTTTAGQVMDAFGLYCSNDGTTAAQVRSLVYADNAGQPGALIEVGPEVVIPAGQTARWVPLALTGSPVMAAKVWIGWWNGGGNLTVFTNSVTAAERFLSFAYSSTGNPPNPISGTLTFDLGFALYADYQAIVTKPLVAANVTANVTMTGRITTFPRPVSGHLRIGSEYFDQTGALTPNWKQANGPLPAAVSIPSGSRFDKFLLYAGNAVTSPALVRFVLYADNGGVPGALLGYTNSVSIALGAPMGIYSSPASIPASGKVWIGIWNGGGAFDAGISIVPNCERRIAEVYSDTSPPASLFGAGALLSAQFALVADYTTILISGNINSTSSMSGTIGFRRSLPATGISATSVVTFAPAVVRRIVPGIILASSSMDGSIVRTRRITPTQMSAFSQLFGTLIGFHKITGQINAASTMGGSVRTFHRIGGQVAATSTVVGALTQFPIKVIRGSGQVLATSTISGSLRRLRPVLPAQITTTTTVTATLRVARGISLVHVLAASSVAGTVIKRARIAPTNISATITVTASLAHGVPRPISGIVITTSGNVSGAIQAGPPRALGGHVQSTSIVLGALRRRAVVTPAVVTSTGQVSGHITLLAPITPLSILAASSIVGGALYRRIGISGLISATSAFFPAQVIVTRPLASMQISALSTLSAFPRTLTRIFPANVNAFSIVEGNADIFIADNFKTYRSILSVV